MKRKPMKSKPTRSSPADIADAFLDDSKLLEKGVLKLARWKGSFWKWISTHYVKISDNDLFTYVMRYLRKHSETRKSATASLCKGVIDNLKAICALSPEVVQPAWLARDRESGSEVPGAAYEGNGAKAENLISLMNGIFDFDAFLKGKDTCLYKHTPLFFCSASLPFAFDSKARCPRWDTFVEQVLPDPECRQLLQEWFGYCLVFDVSQQRFLIMYGDGANGKTVVCQVLTALLGKANLSSVPLERFGNKFSLVNMHGKLANIVSEMGNSKNIPENYLKALTSGDMLDFEQKFQEAFSAVPTARLVFATNKLPKIADRTDAVWRRMMLLLFPKKFEGENQDKQLFSKLEAELPGIFNWALRGLVSLRTRNEFIEPRVSIAAIQEYRLEANPALIFFREHCKYNKAAFIRCTLVYEQYRTWAQQNGYSPLCSGEFGKEIKRWHPDCTPSKKTIDGARHNCYNNVAYIGDEFGDSMAQPPHEEAIPATVKVLHANIA